MAATNIIWLEFAGNGFVCGPFDSSVMSAATNTMGNVWEVTMAWTDVYGGVIGTDRMIHNVGARVWVEGYSARKVPDGYYTITSATITHVTITGAFSATPLPGAPASTASIRIEDFYKFSNGVPEWVPNDTADFVTGSSARSRWMTIIEQDGLSPTMGQKIKARGGVSSFDGLSISTIFVNDNELDDLPPWSGASTRSGIDDYLAVSAFKRSIRAFYPTANEDDSIASSSMSLFESITSTATAIKKRGIAAPASKYLSLNAAFEFNPVMIDREAFLIEDAAGGADSGDPSYELNVERGILDTGFHPEGTSHSIGSLWYDALQTGQSAIAKLRDIAADALTYDLDAAGATLSTIIYSGIVEDISFGNSTSVVNFELSPQIFGAGKQSWDAKLGSNGKIKTDLARGQMVLFVEDYPESVFDWDWIELEGVAIRIRDPYTPAQKSSAFTLTDTGKFDIETVIDHIVFDPTPGTLLYNDNHVIIKESKDEMVFARKSRLRSRNIEELDEDTLILAPDRDLPDSDIVINTTDGDARFLGRNRLRTPDVLKIDANKFPNRPVSACHVFEYSAIVSINDNTDVTEEESPGFVARITVVELLLQILTSNNGDGSNGVFDVLPKGLGLAIQKNDIDYPSFAWDFDAETYDLSLPTSSDTEKMFIEFNNVVVTAKDSDKISKWMSKNVLEPLNLALIQNDAGKMSLVDMTQFTLTTGGFPSSTLADNDLEFDHSNGSFNFSQRYDSSQLFDRVVIETSNPSVDPRDGQKTTITTVPIQTSGDDTGAGARLYTQLSAEPLKLKIPFGVFNARNALNAPSSRFVQLYSKILPVIEFKARTSDFELGDKIFINLSGIVAPDGSRGLQGFGIIIDKKRNILARQSMFKVLVIGDNYPSSELHVWSTSGEVVAAGSAGSTVVIKNTQYVTDLASGGSASGWTTDSAGFNGEDYLILYSENFELLSLDGSNEADPREIVSITPGASTTTIVFSSAFTDGAGVNITYVDGQILTFGEKSLQTVASQDINGWIQDSDTKWQ